MISSVRETGAGAFGYLVLPQDRHVVFYPIGESGIEIIGIVHRGADVDEHLGTE
jgi:hypothetical protein